MIRYSAFFVVQALATFQQHGLDPKVNELGESLIPVLHFIYNMSKNRK